MPSEKVTCTTYFRVKKRQKTLLTITQRNGGTKSVPPPPFVSALNQNPHADDHHPQRKYRHQQSRMHDTQQENQRQCIACWRKCRRGRSLVVDGQSCPRLTRIVMLIIAVLATLALFGINAAESRRGLRGPQVRLGELKQGWRSAGKGIRPCETARHLSGDEAEGRRSDVDFPVKSDKVSILEHQRRINDSVSRNGNIRDVDESAHCRVPSERRESIVERAGEGLGGVPPSAMLMLPKLRVELNESAVAIELASSKNAAASKRDENSLDRAGLTMVRFLFLQNVVWTDRRGRDTR